MTELECLALKHGTDKASHGYCPHYEKLIGEFRNLPCTLIEIGIGSGASLKMWREWMPNSTIYGIDINEYKGEGFRTFVSNQNDTQNLNHILQQTGHFHLLIDDAGHDRKDQKACMDFMFDRVEVGGWYIIEDLGGTQDLPDFTFTGSVEELHLICGNGGWILFLKKR